MISLFLIPFNDLMVIDFFFEISCAKKYATEDVFEKLRTRHRAAQAEQAV